MGSESSTYRSDYTNAQLYELVRKAALKFGQPRPLKFSTRKFDAARALIGEPKAPSGRWIAKRLGHPWPEVIKIALDSQRDVTMTDSAARRSAAEKWLDLRHLYFALNFVAKERGVRSFTADDYDLTCEGVAKAAQNGGNATLPMILPTSGQIIQIARRIEKANEAKSARATAAAPTPTEEAPRDAKKRKSRAKAPKKTRELLAELDETETDAEAAEEEKLGWWNKALVLAGLEPFEVDRLRGVPIPQAIHLYIEATGGLLPSSYPELKRFAKEADFSLAAEHRYPGDKGLGSGLRPHLAAVAALRESLGLPMADEIANVRGGRPKPVFDLSTLPPGLPQPVRPTGFWDDAKILAALIEYLDTVAARNVRQPTQGDYRDEQKKRPRDWPAAATLGRVGPKSFTAWIERAQKEQARRTREGGEKAA